MFDECHKAKNLVPTGASKPSKTGLTVLQLQKKLPKARIVYCSATGASEPRNMAYMSRLGIWGPSTQFPAFHDFIKAVERRYTHFCMSVCAFGIYIHVPAMLLFGIVHTLYAFSMYRGVGAMEIVAMDMKVTTLIHVYT